MQNRFRILGLFVMDSKHTRSHIFGLNFGFDWKPVTKNLIEYNCNKLEENEELEKQVIDNEFTEQKADPENYKNTIDFRLSDLQGEKRKTLKANLIENLQKKAD